MPTHQYKCRQTHWHDCGWSILGKHGHCTGNLRNATMTSPTIAFPPHTSYRACNLTCTYPHSATHFEGCTCSHLQYNPTPTVICLSHLQTHDYSKEDIDASAHTHVHLHMHTCKHRYTWSHQRTSACNCGSDLQHIGTQMCQGSRPCTCVHTDQPIKRTQTMIIGITFTPLYENSTSLTKQQQSTHWVKAIVISEVPWTKEGLKCPEDLLEKPPCHWSSKLPCYLQYPPDSKHCWSMTSACPYVNIDRQLDAREVVLYDRHTHRGVKMAHHTLQSIMGTQIVNYNHFWHFVIWHCIALELNGIRQNSVLVHSLHVCNLIGPNVYHMQCQIPVLQATVNWQYGSGRSSQGRADPHM